MNPADGDIVYDGAIVSRALDGSVAFFSDDGRYRYWLTRVLGDQRVCVVNLFALRSTDPDFIGETEHDPVGPRCDAYITRALKYALRGQCNVFIMLNPSTADAFADDPTIRRVKAFASRPGFPSIIAAWGRPRSPRVRAMVDARVERLIHEVIFPMLPRDGSGPHVEIHCLGRTKDGHPRHPLFLPKDTEPALWRVLRRSRFTMQVEDYDG